MERARVLRRPARHARGRHARGRHAHGRHARGRHARGRARVSTATTRPTPQCTQSAGLRALCGAPSSRRCSTTSHGSSTRPRICGGGKSTALATSLVSAAHRHRPPTARDGTRTSHRDTTWRSPCEPLPPRHVALRLLACVCGTCACTCTYDVYVLRALVCAVRVAAAARRQQLVGGLAGIRRRMAQQPPCVRVLGAPWTAAPPV
jgi:hypothetical protein